MDEVAASEERTRKALQHRQYVLAEFIESEREYVRRLEIAHEDYFLHIKLGASENIPPELKNDLLPLFSTLPEISAFHKEQFLPDLEGCNWQEDPDAVMECFLKHKSEFGTYLSYCKNKPSSDRVRVEYETYFTRRQTELGHKLNIEDLLIAPVQRLPKYQLLIKDLLKDTRKAHLNSTKIEEALKLMLKIPQDTNNIICMSLIRGISPANLISHGSLWRQDTLHISCTANLWPNEVQLHSSLGNKSLNLKNEPRQVFLFDHRILIAYPADSDGFFEYQICFKTLNSRVTEENDDTTFSFITGDQVTCFLKASSPSVRKEWITDIRSILDSQAQMKKALVFGKTTPTSLQTVRMHSLSVDWSDSDSSIDSLPSSADEDAGEDWPEHAGFQKLSKSGNFLTVPGKMPGKRKKHLLIRHSPPPSVGNNRRRATDTGVLNQLVLERPSSCNLDSITDFDQSMQRKSHALSISPRMLRNWVARRTASQAGNVRIYFPSKSAPSFNFSIRSPGSRPHNKPVSHNEVLFITVADLPAIAKQLYSPRPGQVFLVEDVSQVEVWKVKALSGDIAGVSVWVQRNCLEEYSAPISLRHWKKEYRTMKSLSVGRFSKMKQAKSRSSDEVHAVKVFQSGTGEDQFYRELCIGVRMRHRNLVHYHMGQQSQDMSISMEFINGRLLFDYLIRKASVTEKTVADLMHQVLEGLDYMHKHTVYHLDIRPGNIMMDLARDTIKIIDYGAARHSGDVDEVLSQNFETCYNYEFVPPEVFQQVLVGPGTDMWGVGLIIYTIFFGCTPFYSESSVRIIADITSLRYSFPDLGDSPCSQSALELIKSILVLSPSQRPSAESAKQHCWFSEAAGLTGNRVHLNKLRQFMSQHNS